LDTLLDWYIAAPADAAYLIRKHGRKTGEEFKVEGK
jgi:hypothetical protein